MTKSSVFALTAAGVIAYSLFRKGAAAGTLNFFPDKVHSLEFDGLTPVLSLGLGVQNTSNQSFTIKSFAGSLYCNGYYVGNVSSFLPQTISPNSQRVISVDVRLQPLGIVNDIIRAFENNNFSQEVEIKATVNVDNVQVVLNPLKFTIGL